MTTMTYEERLAAQRLGVSSTDLLLEAPPRRERFSILRRTGPWRDAFRRRLLAGADLVALVLAWLAGSIAGLELSLLWTVVSLPIWLILAKLYGLYDQDHRGLRHLTVDELPSLIAWITTGSATYFALLSIVGQQSVSGSQAVNVWLVLLVAVPCLRAIARTLWRRIVPAERALLVGSGALESATLRKLELFRDIHVDCVRVVDDRLSDKHGKLSDATAAVESALARREGLDRIIVASHHVSEALIAGQVALCRRHGLKLSVVPPARGMFGTAVQLSHIADLPMIEYSTWSTGRSSLLLKRLLDVAVAAMAVLLLAPLLLAIAAVVRLTSKGPALFVQTRAGLHGSPFRMYKFRTMARDAEARLSEFVAIEELKDPMFKLRHDPRMTRVGRLLRRTSLDELPQLLNVLQGTMSLVGPRPEQLDLVQRYAPEHRFRLAAKPGITGPMQVYGRGELRFDERLAVEREYVENLSLRRDVRLLLLTVATVFRGRGAF